MTGSGRATAGRARRSAASLLSQAVRPGHVLPDLGRPSKVALERAMQGHILAQAELIGTYAKTRR